MSRHIVTRGLSVKVSSEVILESYSRLKSVWRVGEEVGLCGQSVHERLVSLGAVNKRRVFTEAELALIRNTYEGGIVRGDGKLKALSEKMDRAVPLISRKARSMGLTSYRRKGNEAYSESLRKAGIQRHIDHEHPRGMSGKKHTKKSKATISAKSIAAWERMTQEERSNVSMKRLKTRQKNGTLHGPRVKTTWKQGWREIGGVRKYYRSRWEANYARYLEMLKERGEIKSWEHEPETFWFEAIKRGTRSYLPDFRVITADGEIEYHEVKGWMDDRSKTKLKRMAKYHPTVKIVLIQADFFKKNRILAGLIEGWEPQRQ